MSQQVEENSHRSEKPKMAEMFRGGVYARALTRRCPRSPNPQEERVPTGSSEFFTGGVYERQSTRRSQKAENADFAEKCMQVLDTFQDTESFEDNSTEYVSSSARVERRDSGHMGRRFADETRLTEDSPPTLPRPTGVQRAVEHLLRLYRQERRQRSERRSAGSSSVQGASSEQVRPMFSGLLGSSDVTEFETEVDVRSAAAEESLPEPVREQRVRAGSQHGSGSSVSRARAAVVGEGHQATYSPTARRIQNDVGRAAGRVSPERQVQCSSEQLVQGRASQVSEQPASDQPETARVQRVSSSSQRVPGSVQGQRATGSSRVCGGAREEGVAMYS